MSISPIDRRGFLTAASALGAGCLLGTGTARAEPPPETTRFRIAQGPFICYAPQMLAEELLRLEGFTDVQYLPIPGDHTLSSIVASGGVDLAVFGPTTGVAALDKGWPLVMVSGVHIGCWELMGSQRVPTVHDLKGKRIAVLGMGSVDQLWIASILAYVGVHPVKDVEWVPTRKMPESMRLFVEGEVDAFLAFPPQPHELRARNVGHVLVDTTLDRPWSHYFCCMASLPKDFVTRNPVATKRALRALLKATDICAREPEAAARYLVQKGYETRYDVALDVFKKLPYGRWRTDNPEDSLRFHALRLYDVGMIRNAPQTLIAQGTDWRFLNELKRELKA